jgi:hypothetical protein
MARFNYSSYVSKESTKRSGDSADYKVSFFNLKDDGEEATVRFAYNTIEDFHLVTVHAIEVEGKPKRVSCLRTGNEPLSKCPLCESGNRVYDKMYVKLIQYTTENKVVTQQAKIWERPAYLSKTLESYFKEYGVLADSVFKIKRRGKKGDTKTTYDILYANPVIYKPEIYLKDFSAFEGFEINKFFYTERSADDMRVFLKTGKFPEKQKNVTENIAPAVSTYQPTVKTQPVVNSQPVVATAQPVENKSNTESNTTETDPTSQRPRRYNY